MDWRRWFYLSRADRGVLLFLMGCVLAVFVVYKCLYPGGDAPADYTAADARLEDSLRRELEGRVGLRKAAGRDSSATRRTLSPLTPTGPIPPRSCGWGCVRGRPPTP